MEGGGAVQQAGRRELVHAHHRELDLLAGRGGQRLEGGKGLQQLQLRRLLRIVEGVGGEGDGEPVGGLVGGVVVVVGGEGIEGGMGRGALDTSLMIFIFVSCTFNYFTLSEI